MKRICLLPLFALFASALFAQDITLANPPAKLGIDVLEAIRTRSAARGFAKRDVSVADLSTIVLGWQRPQGHFRCNQRGIESWEHNRKRPINRNC